MTGRARRATRPTPSLFRHPSGDGANFSRFSSDAGASSKSVLAPRSSTDVSSWGTRSELGGNADGSDRYGGGAQGPDGKQRRRARRPAQPIAQSSSSGLARSVADGYIETDHHLDRGSIMMRTRNSCRSCDEADLSASICDELNDFVVSYQLSTHTGKALIRLRDQMLSCYAPHPIDNCAKCSSWLPVRTQV